MRNILTRLRIWIGRTSNGGIWGQILLALGFQVIGIVIVIFVSWLFLNTEDDWTAWHAFNAMLGSEEISESVNHLPESRSSIWGYTIIYFVGVFLFSGILIATITNLMRSSGRRYIGGTQHYNWRNHVLFLGYDDLMIGTIKHLLDNGEKHELIIVAVSDNAEGVRNMLRQKLETKELRHVEVVRAKRVDVSDLRSTCLTHAKRIFIVGHPGEAMRDATNLKSLSMVSGLCSAGRRKPIVMVHIEEPSTFAILQQNGFKTAALVESTRKYLCKNQYCESALEPFLDQYCEPFNFFESAARRLLLGNDGIRLDWHSKERNIFVNNDLQVRLVVLGMSPMAMALVKEVLKTMHFPSRRPMVITMVDPAADTEMHRFVAETREMMHCCRYAYVDLSAPESGYEYLPDRELLDVEFEFVKGDAFHPLLTAKLEAWASDSTQLTTLAVCTADPARNITIGAMLPKKVRESRVPVWIYQTEASCLDRMLPDNADIHSFSFTDLAAGISSLDVEYQWANSVAQQFNKNYSNKSYQMLPHWERWATLYNVISFGAKLRSHLGWQMTIVANRIHIDDLLQGTPVTHIALDEATLHLMGRTEHNRWNMEKLLAGYEPTDDQQHKAVMDELHAILSGDGGGDAVEPQRHYFRELKARKIHDDIRTCDSLLDSASNNYTFQKDLDMINYLVETINDTLSNAVI